MEIKSKRNNLVAKVNTDNISSVFEKQYKKWNEKQLQQVYNLGKEKPLKVTPFNWSFIISLVINMLLLFYM